MELVGTLKIKSKDFPVFTYNQKILVFYYDSIMISKDLKCLQYLFYLYI